MKTRCIVLAVFVLQVMGCAAGPIQSFRNQGLARAAFELNCPEQNITLTELQPHTDSINGRGGQVGVSGCGHRLVYVSTIQGWILNGDSRQSQSGDAADSPVPNRE